MPEPGVSSPLPRMVLQNRETGPTAVLEGAFVLARMSVVEPMLRGTANRDVKAMDLTGVTALDTAGAWLILTMSGQSGAVLQGESPAQKQLMATVLAAMPRAVALKRPSGPHLTTLQTLARIGEATTNGAAGLMQITGFFGLTVARTVHTVFHPSRLRLTALVFHMQQTGLNAVPIVALMAFLIGIVLAFQGADQLKQFGAEVFVVDLIALSVLRELGILLTAIIVAGRSASAFTAAIGSMKMREEVDAMRTLGIDPIEVLVLPRIIGLVLMLPVLGLIADVMGLFGGAMMSWYELGISPAMFQTRLLDTDVSHFLVGIVKAPFFAVIIAVIGCFQGFQVESNAESLGKLTSRAVVQAIFMVILADATFSVFFAAVGV